MSLRRLLPPSETHLGLRLGVLTLCAGWLVALYGFHVADPSPLNLRTPPTGVYNPLGLPGALLAGACAEAFGAAAWSLPLGLAWRFFAMQGALSWPRSLFYGGIATTAYACLLGFYAQAEAPAAIGFGAFVWNSPGWGGGWAGESGAQWVQDTLGEPLGALLVAFLGFHALWRIFAGPLRALWNTSALQKHP